MVFYGYTLKKQIKSVSTYITGVVALFPIWLTTILFLKGNSSPDVVESTSSFIAFITFPVGMIFMSFKISQIFRDEIENKTLLSIQSKPITRKQMVFQGILVVITWSLALSLFCGFIPFIALSIKFGGNLALHGLLLMLTSLLLLVMIGILGLWLSLSMSGKAFVGTMIGGFVVGFYVLFAISTIVGNLASKNTKLTNLSSKYSTIMSKNNDEREITVPVTENIQKIYDEVKAIDDASVYTMYSWISPSSQWAKMFAANTKASGKSTSDHLDPIEALIGETSVSDVKMDEKTRVITFKVVKQHTPPIWFPYIFWVAIGGITIPLMIKSISKKNIA